MPNLRDVLSISTSFRRKKPEDWPEFKVRVQSAYQAPSRAIARDLAAGVVADYSRQHDGAVACFMDDFEACIAHLRLPVTHRRATRATKLLERLLVEERRRLKIIPNAFGERAVFSPSARGREEGTRSRIRGPTQSHSQALKGRSPNQNIQQFSDLTPKDTGVL